MSLHRAQNFKVTVWLCLVSSWQHSLAGQLLDISSVSCQLKIEIHIMQFFDVKAYQPQDLHMTSLPFPSVPGPLWWVKVILYYFWHVLYCFGISWGVLNGIFSLLWLRFTFYTFPTHLGTRFLYLISHNRFYHRLWNLTLYMDISW